MKKIAITLMALFLSLSLISCDTTDVDEPEFETFQLEVNFRYLSPDSEFFPRIVYNVEVLQSNRSIVVVGSHINLDFTEYIGTNGALPNEVLREDLVVEVELELPPTGVYKVVSVPFYDF